MTTSGASLDPHHAREPDPSPWVVRFAHLIEGPRVLDLACGRGRHARFLASRGHRVVAVDRDRTLLQSLSGVDGVEAREADLEAGAWPLEGESFDGIVVVNYLHRPLFAPLLRALAPGGALIYETFAAGNERFGRPSNPAFLLAPGELLAAFAGSLTVVAFEQGRVEQGGRTAVVQRIAAVGRERHWPPTAEPPGPPRANRVN